MSGFILLLNDYVNIAAIRRNYIRLDVDNGTADTNLYSIIVELDSLQLIVYKTIIGLVNIQGELDLLLADLQKTLDNPNALVNIGTTFDDITSVILNGGDTFNKSTRLNIGGSLAFFVTPDMSNGALSLCLYEFPVKNVILKYFSMSLRFTVIDGPTPVDFPEFGIGTENAADLVTPDVTLATVNSLEANSSVDTIKVLLATTLNLDDDDGVTFGGSITYNATGGTSGRGQITGITGNFLDGTLFNDGDRILLKDQTSADQNGIWVPTQNVVFPFDWVFDRAADYDEDSEVLNASIIGVTGGRTNFGKGYTLTNPDPITIGGGSGDSLVYALSSYYTATAGVSGRGQLVVPLVTADTFTIDGVTLSSADNETIILLANQTDQQENGIYTTTILGTTLTLDRAPKFNKDGSLVDGLYAPILSGTVNSGNFYILATANPIIVGGASGSPQNWIAEKRTVKVATTVDILANGQVAVYNFNEGAEADGFGISDEIRTNGLVVSDQYIIDGVTFTSADTGTRILLKNQAIDRWNGIWTMSWRNADNLSFYRATDFNKAGDVITGVFVDVLMGTVNGGNQFTLTTPNPVADIGGFNIGGNVPVSITFAAGATPGLLLTSTLTGDQQNIISKFIPDTLSGTSQEFSVSSGYTDTDGFSIYLNTADSWPATYTIEVRGTIDMTWAVT